MEYYRKALGKKEEGYSPLYQYKKSLAVYFREQILHSTQNSP